VEDQKIKRSRAQCLKCGDIIESTHRHDFQYCKCQSIFLDGGKSYIRYGGEKYNIKLMTEYE
jgi:ribosomal protein S27AE